MRDYVRAHYDDDIALLERAVNISSGSQNAAGVRRVGELFGAQLAELGFTVRMSDMPTSMRRGGHLIADKQGSRGPRLLLIGHLDTVFGGEGQRFVRQDTIARGAGTSDMKGGDVAMIAALRALHATGGLESSRIVVIMTGDEEAVGSPREFARGGFGAIYEAARIVDTLRRELSGDPTLTFNRGVIAGGTDVERDSSGAMTVSGKTNIISPKTIVTGDLRFLRESQKNSARARMRAIVAQHLVGGDAEITFRDGYPAMPPTAAGAGLLAQFDAVSRSLGYGVVEGDPPESSGAGDVSFVAPYMTGMDGLGVAGRGAHSPEESVNLNSLTMAAERAAILMRRLITGTR
ncbi:MAG: M20/M25/M40 family metallo-hydrolase [Gemmatimonadaceae bacterium]